MNKMHKNYASNYAKTILFTFAVLFSITVEAVPVTFKFQGIVSSIPNWGWIAVDPILSGEFSTGDIITGTYTFESTSPDTLPADPNHGYYFPILGFNVIVGGYHVTATGGNFIEVGINDPALPASGGFKYVYNISIPRVSGGYDLLAPPINGVGDLLWVSLGMLWASGDGFTSDQLPIVFPNISDPNAVSYFEMAWSHSTGAIRVHGKILSIGPLNQLPIPNAGLNQTITSEQQCGTVIQGTASDPDNDPLTYRWLEGQTELLGSTTLGANGEAYLDLCNVPLVLGTRTLTLEVSDGKATATDDVILTIDNSAPHAAPTGGGTYQISAPITVGGQVSDFDNDPLAYSWHKGATQYCAGSVQAPANSLPGTPITLPDCALPSLGLGEHILTLTVSDGINPPVSGDITVEVIDSTAPTLSPEPDKSILWPPNHKMVNITIVTHASDNSGPPTLSAVVTSNEPDNGLGDGDTAPDWTDPVITDGVITLQLRAERSGSGNGREYMITITATDASGNASTASVKILVPHDKGK